ncbi:MAG: cytochrome c1 [Pseudomonadota bacterium]|nr:cytochrome c1 [Pseudomonadota bacterium]
MNRYFLIVILSFLFSDNIFSSEKIILDQVSINIHNKPSLQRGAKIFMNNCLGCHTLKYQRYSKFINHLGMPKEVIEKNLIFTTDKYGEPTKIGSLIINAVDEDFSKEAFGVTPPDLSLIVRSRGADWVYTFLTSFYKDDSRPLGVNNKLYPNVSMPHALWWMEGLKKPVEGNPKKYSYVVTGSLSEKEYKQAVTDLVNFLAYVSEPAQLERYKVGFWVLLFLSLFAFLAYLLKKEYWRDID